MLSHKFEPRFADTDALGHINNTMLPIWFEDARTPLFKYFTPDLDPKKWRLIIAKIDVEFLAEMFYGHEVEIRTYLGKIGNSSMTVCHEAWQKGKMTAKGTAIMIHFDHQEKQSKPIPDDIREELNKYLKED